MTIGTNDFIEKYGTPDDLDSTSAEITTGSFSIASDVVTPWVNDDDAPFAAITLSCTFGTTAVEGEVVNLYGRMLNIDSANDVAIPTAAHPVGLLGSFRLETGTSAQYHQIVVKLPNGKTSAEYEFYIENGSSQTLSAGWILKVTPIAIGPHA